MKNFIFSIAVFICLFYSFSDAQNTEKTNFMFWSRMTMGQVVSSSPLYNSMFELPFEKEWFETFDGGIKVIREISPSLSGRLNLGVIVNAATMNHDVFNGRDYRAKRVLPVLLDATLEARHTGLLMANDTLTIEFGYFPFKYNYQSTNLGEYLFRSGTYPGWLTTGFEQSIEKPKLAGVHLSHTFGSNIKLKQDLVINTELDVYPLRDINVTYIASPSIGRFANLGFGVQLARLLAVDPKKTTPGEEPKYQNKQKPLFENRIGYIDTANHDTILYTFRGTKLMGRFSLDFKALFGDLNGFFGTEDLKLYGEAALLGVKNYPGWYSKRGERIPMMAGINWPTNQLVSYTLIPGVMAYLLEPKEPNKNIKTAMFGAGGLITGIGTWLLDRSLHTNSKLDLISIEFEYYPSPYVNTQSNIWIQGGSPIPYVHTLEIPNYDTYWRDSLSKASDGLKWSVYISKKFGTHFRLSAQATCDHTPKSSYLVMPQTNEYGYFEITPKPENWYFMLRSSIYF
jgi:hypothetical protein